MRFFSLSNFFLPILLALLGLVFCWELTKNLNDVFIVMLLAGLEISISADNAIVNANILEKMSMRWRGIFFYFGLPIAVFVVRLALPFLLVSMSSSINLSHVINLAFSDPLSYQIEVLRHQDFLYAFGSGFLSMVFLSFLFLKNKNRESWFKFEKSYWVEFISKNNYLLILLGLIFSGIFAEIKSFELGVIFFLGIFLQRMFSFFENCFLFKQGFLLFIYLELLDASFSFDSVLGAFAFTSNPWIMMIGLGIGAAFVRVFTLKLLDKKTLKKFIFLEHGAHYAIGALGIILGLEIFIHVPAGLSALIGFSLIGKSFYDSNYDSKEAY